MAFADEIVKAKSKAYAYLEFVHGENARGSWLGPDERRYASAHVGTYVHPFKGTVERFGTFSRSIANATFSLEVPTITSQLLDPSHEWRDYSDWPHDALLSKWLKYLVRVHDDQDDIYDALIAEGIITKVTYPPGRRIGLQTRLASAEYFGGKFPRRLITLDDWPLCPPENLGRGVPTIYGVVANTATAVQGTPTDDTPTETCTTVCCVEQEFLPAPYSYERSNALPSMRWSDHFRLAQGGTPDAWLVQNYINIVKCNIVAADDPACGNVLRSEDGEGEITRGVGPQTYPDLAGSNEVWNTYPAQWGPPASQFGAAGMYRTMASAQAATLTTSNEGRLISLRTHDDNGDGISTGLKLYVAGKVGRRNGAKLVVDADSTPDSDNPDTRFENVEYQTPAMKNILVADAGQLIEMEWKISSRVAPANDAPSATDYNQYAADGWVKVWVDGELKCYLQEITFDLNVDQELVNTTQGLSATYWEDVSFRPQGDANCVYVSDRLRCDDSVPQTLEVPDPCNQQVGNTAGGALSAILVDANVMMVQAAGISAVTQDNSSAPLNAAAFVTDYPTSGTTGGRIPANTSMYYRVTAVKNGVESSWTDLLTTGYSETHADAIVWDDPAGGTPDYFRVYQMTSDDLQLNQDMGGTLRAETFWVKEVPAVPNNGVFPDFSPRTYIVKFWAIGDGAPMVAAHETSETLHVIAGHSMYEVTDVFAPLDSFIEQAGGLNLFTGEKEPITFVQGPKVMTRLTEGVDYEVVEVEKPSGRFTVIKVTKDIRSSDNCEYAPVTCNVKGIEDRGDGTGSLITDGIQIVKHWFLNWVFNNYRTGLWFTDVTDRPGLLDLASFDVASDVARVQFGVPYVGAVVLSDVVAMSALVEEAIRSFGLDLFYKNGFTNEHGAWAVELFDPDDLDVSSYPSYEHQLNIEENTFECQVTDELIVNSLTYKAGPDWKRGVANGWLVSGVLTSQDSINRFGLAEKELTLPWTRHQPTAVDVAQRFHRFRCYPLMMGTMSVSATGILHDPGRKIRITHPDGPKPGGFNDEVCRIWGHDFDLGRLAPTFRFVSVHRLMGA